MNYTKKVMDHFANPRNVGVMEDASGVGEVGNPTCGDMMTFYVKVKDDRLEDVKFQTFGCGAAIAVSSMISEMAKGKTINEVMNISNKDVAEELGGLPQNKMHCSNLGADALQKAIESYRNGGTPVGDDGHGDPHCAAEGDEHCPYCGAHVEGEDHKEHCELRPDRTGA